MGNRLEQFINDNRDQFDSDEPGEQVWKKLEQQLAAEKNQITNYNNQNAKPKTQKSKQANVFMILRWSAAAAILILAGVGVYSLLNKPVITGPIVEKRQPPAVDPLPPAGDAILKDINPTYAQEVYHFTQLIELKQNELKEIEKENPYLYKKFVSDINKLDSSYNALKRELPANPNREQLLQAMIENLRLQTGILNQQLNIINQIKASKSDRHESNFKKTT
jgi:hypothetical protein